MAARNDGFFIADDDTLGKIRHYMLSMKNMKYVPLVFCIMLFALGCQPQKRHIKKKKDASTEIKGAKLKLSWFGEGEKTIHAERGLFAANRLSLFQSAISTEMGILSADRASIHLDASHRRPKIILYDTEFILDGIRIKGKRFEFKKHSLLADDISGKFCMGGAKECL